MSDIWKPQRFIAQLLQNPSCCSTVANSGTLNPDQIQTQLVLQVKNFTKDNKIFHEKNSKFLFRCTSRGYHAMKRPGLGENMYE